MALNTATYCRPNSDPSVRKRSKGIEGYRVRNTCISRHVRGSGSDHRLGRDSSTDDGKPFAVAAVPVSVEWPSSLLARVSASSSSSSAG
jgi:hypothetical protein